jgi:hypothetical protein
LPRCRIAGSDTSLAIDRDCGGLRERGDRNTSWDCKEKCGGKPSKRAHGWVGVSFGVTEPARPQADRVTRGAGFRHIIWWMPHSQAEADHGTPSAWRQPWRVLWAASGPSHCIALQAGGSVPITRTYGRAYWQLNANQLSFGQ